MNRKLGPEDKRERTDQCNYDTKITSRPRLVKTLGGSKNFLKVSSCRKRLRGGNVERYTHIKAGSRSLGTPAHGSVVLANGGNARARATGGKCTVVQKKFLFIYSGFRSMHVTPCARTKPHGIVLDNRLRCLLQHKKRVLLGSSRKPSMLPCLSDPPSCFSPGYLPSLAKLPPLAKSWMVNAFTHLQRSTCVPLSNNHNGQTAPAVKTRFWIPIFTLDSGSNTL
jgi:hypothetical protein